MFAKKTLILSLVSLTALTACETSTQRIQDPNYRTQNGAIAGAVGGAILGAAFSDNKGAGAIRGALIGTAIGGGIGANLDAQAADMRARLGNPNITVTNMGDYLLVNLPQDVTFATGSASVRPDLARDIQSIAANLVTYPNSNIEVVGHTDNVGTAAFNDGLSERRALAVRQALIDRSISASDKLISALKATP